MVDNNIIMKFKGTKYLNFTRTWAGHGDGSHVLFEVEIKKGWN
jgi:hypothetical protein